MDDEPHELLALLDRDLLCVGGEARAAPLERLGQCEIGLGVVQFGVEGVQVGTQRRLTATRFGQAGRGVPRA